MMIYKYVVEIEDEKIALKYKLLQHRMIIGGKEKFKPEMRDILTNFIEDIEEENIPKFQYVTPNKGKFKFEDTGKRTWDELIENLEESPWLIYTVDKHGRIMR